MFENEQHSTLAPRVRTLQLIVAALAMGTIILLGIALLVPVGEPRPGDAAPILTYVALAYGLAALPAGPLLSTVVTTMTRRRLQEGAARGKPAAVGDMAADDKDLPVRLIALYVTKTIIGAATHEGAALMLGVAYLLERSPLTRLFHEFCC